MVQLLPNASNSWFHSLQVDPLKELAACEDPAIHFYVQRDLIGENPGPIQQLWDLPEPGKLVKDQLPTGAWHYKGSGPKRFPYNNYDLLETFRSLGILVQQYGMDREHDAIARAAEYILSCQSELGDLRGIIGNQFMPYYHGMLLAFLIQAGYATDARVLEGLDWLASMRQDDGGWVVPMQQVPASEKTDAAWQSAPVEPQRDLPSSHLATGMALRAFAVHPQARKQEEALCAGRWLASRMFISDSYNDRKARAYWLKFQVPYWWNNLLMALDSLSLLGFSTKDVDMQRGLTWFVENQAPDGLWPTGYGSGKKAHISRQWVGLEVCRVLRSFAR